MYNEYIAKEGKVLLNIKDFSYGNKIISKEDLSAYLYEVDIDIAKEYMNKYLESTYKLRENILNETLKNKRNNINSKNSISLLNINNEINSNIENNNTEINNIKATLLSDLLFNNEVSKQNIQIIIHE